MRPKKVGGTNAARFVGRLRNWERDGRVFHGAIYGHPAYPNGHEMTTSPVRRCVQRGPKRLVATTNGVYEIEGVGSHADELWFQEQCEISAARGAK